MTNAVCLREADSGGGRERERERESERERERRERERRERERGETEEKKSPAVCSIPKWGERKAASNYFGWNLKVKRLVVRRR